MKRNTIKRSRDLLASIDTNVTWDTKRPSQTSWGCNGCPKSVLRPCMLENRLTKLKLKDNRLYVMNATRSTVHTAYTRIM